MNVRSLSKLSAAVMTLAILSYCGKKPHDTASLASANTPLSCQTADEIRTHVINVDHKAEAFCFHKVEHPAASLRAGIAIDADMQLKQGLDVAILNRTKTFAEAQASCKSLGAGWHAPSSDSAIPRPSSSSNSTAKVSLYFMNTINRWIWSSGMVSWDTDRAYYVDLEIGYAFEGSYFKGGDAGVMCVKE